MSTPTNSPAFLNIPTNNPIANFYYKQFPIIHCLFFNSTDYNLLTHVPATIHINSLPTYVPVFN